MWAQLIGWNVGAVGLSVWNVYGVDLLCRASCLFHTLCSSSGGIWIVKDQYHPNLITSQNTQAKAPLISYTITYFCFPRYFFEILNPVLFALLLLWLKFLFLSFLAFPLILSIIPCSSSLASGVLVCLVNCIPLLRQKCRGSVGQETPATSSYSTGAFSLVITTIVA